MILVDVNVVVAAFRQDHPDHPIARPWLRQTATGEQFAVPMTRWGSFVRLVSGRAIFPVPSDMQSAFAFIAAVRGQPSHFDMEPGARHLQI